MTTMRPAGFWGALAAAMALPGAILAQNNFDNSGNSLVMGTYFVRQVLNANLSSIGQIGEAESLTGTATFDGMGNYTLTAQVSDTTVSSGAPQSMSFTGTYAVSSSGVFIMDNPLSSGDSIFGGVGKSALVGSSTESAFFDFMVAVPMGSPATNSSLNGAYRVVAMEYPNGDVTKVTNSTFLINPDGAGNLGAITVSGHSVGVNDNTFQQTITGANYSLSGSTGTLTYPAPSGTPLVSGTKQFFVSSDGNILVGGSLNGYDIEVGIKVSGSSASSSFNGVYFSGGEDYDSSSFGANGYYYLDAFFGSSHAAAAGGVTTVLADHRVNPDDNFTYDYTFDDEFSLASNGSASDPNDYQYFTGAGGTARVAVGQSTLYSIEVDVTAQSLPASSSVFLNPLAVANAANYAPITNPVTPGEFLILFGTGLGPSTPVSASLPYPPMLSGVKVSINGRAAPIYVASATEIICIVPFETAESYAVIQTTYNGVTSNAVTLFTDYSAPGVFTQDQSGTGGAAALHLNGTVVTASNPAIPGETIAVYLTGLGTVTPSVANGVAAPTTTFSSTDDTIDVFVGLQQAMVGFSGLAPEFAGLYQVNFVVPSTQGAVHLDVEDEDNGAYNSMATLYVSGNSSAAAGDRAASVRKRPSNPAIHGIRASASAHKWGRQVTRESH
jgi:uncharacterized protein (TIGR03437 family)